MKITLSKAMIAIASAVGIASAQNLRGPAAQLEEGNNVASFPFPSRSSSKPPSSGHVSRKLTERVWEWTPAPGKDAKDIGCGVVVLATGVDKGTDGSGVSVLLGEVKAKPSPTDSLPFWSDYPEPAGVNIDHKVDRIVTADGNGNLRIFNQNNSAAEFELVPGINATDVGVSMGSTWGAGRVCVIGELLKWGTDGFIYCESLSTPGEFDQLPGYGARIAVKSDGNPVIVNSSGDMWSFNGSNWKKIAKSYEYIDVAVGPDDVIWAVTRSNEVVAILDSSIILDFGTLDFVSTMTVYPISNSPSGAKRISVDSQGHVWVVTEPYGFIHKGEPQYFFS